MRGDSPAEIGIDTEIVLREDVADGVIRLALRPSRGEVLPPWEPGAHIDLLLDEGIVRQYSLCGDHTDPTVFEIAVLREACGRGGSAFVHDKLSQGDQLRIRGPRNHFRLVESTEYVFVAGGIGITPILPMVRHVAGFGLPWRLVYGGRSRSSMAFRQDLVDRYGSRVSVHPHDEVGLIDLHEALGPPRPNVAVYCCGPEPLLRAIEHQCQGWPPGCLHIERFSPKIQQAVNRPTVFEVELARSGQTLIVPEDRSIVDVLEEAGVNVPVSCKEGTCGTCETAVLAGLPDHRDSILTDEERAANDVMFVCVSRSHSPTLRLDR